MARGLGKAHPEAFNIGVKARYLYTLSTNPPHPTAKEARRFFPDEWKRYFKFAVTRNPYERAASDFYWRTRGLRREVTFGQYLRLLRDRTRTAGLVHRGGHSNWEMMTIDGELALDKVGRFENLHYELNELASSHGIPLGSFAEHEKSTRAKGAYGELYGQTERALVESIYQEEIEAFGYEFPYW